MSSEPELSSTPQFVDRILALSVSKRASDIHFDPKATDTIIRLRIDGDMQEVLTLKKEEGVRVIARLKAISGLDIDEKRKPQDGSLETTIARRRFKLRLATSPTPDGESLTIRLLDPETKPKDLRQLGMSDRQAKVMQDFATQTQGLVLVVGPTGSGKTTTVYSLLAHIDCRTRNLVSAEDPVEYRIPFANQQQVNERAGITFDALLRSIMRQDPDILFLGEIRDTYSAKMAMDFASTGHLTISTLHTANATTAVLRLERLGISRDVVADSLLGVVAQRLLKKLCDHCKKIVPLSPAEAAMLAPFSRQLPRQVAHPVGCAQYN